MLVRPWNRSALLLLALAGGCAAPGAGVLHVGSLSGGASDPDGPHGDSGEPDAEALAKKLNNPVANLISVPFQFNRDENIGPDRNGERNYLNLQPVIPIELDEDWNVISRTIVPIIDQQDVFPGAGDQSGLGDITQSFFFSPKKPTADGWIWGVGPALLFPTANDDLLGSGKYGIGPTAVLLKQNGPWTHGVLANHIWSYAGDDDRRSVNSTFLQPFMAYTTSEAVTYTVNSESTYDWMTDKWSVPVNATVGKLVKFGDQRVNIAGGLRYWVTTPDDVGPEGFGFRIIITPLFPK